MSTLPIDDPKKFDAWLIQQWRIKDDLLEQFVQNGRFPADEGYEPITDPPFANGATNPVFTKGPGFIETEVQLTHWYEMGQIFVVLAAFALLFNVGAKIWNLVFYGSMKGLG